MLVPPWQLHAELRAAARQQQLLRAMLRLQHGKRPLELVQRLPLMFQNGLPGPLQHRSAEQRRSAQPRQQLQTWVMPLQHLMLLRTRTMSWLCCYPLPSGKLAEQQLLQLLVLPKVPRLPTTLLAQKPSGCRPMMLLCPASAEVLQGTGRQQPMQIPSMLQGQALRVLLQLSNQSRPGHALQLSAGD